MNQKASLNIEMPGVDFAGMAREAIAAKLTESLISSDDAIIKIVSAALTTKVNEQGVANSRYSYDNKTPFVEWLAQDLIRESTKSVLMQKVETLRPHLEKLIEKELSKNMKSIAASLTQAFASQAKSGYGIKIDMNAQMIVRD